MSKPAIVQTHSMQATRTRPWQAWREPDAEPCYWCLGQHEGLCPDAPYYVADEARYFGIRVTVLERMEQLALVDYAGRRIVVEVRDLVEVRS